MLKYNTKKNIFSNYIMEVIDKETTITTVTDETHLGTVPINKKLDHDVLLMNEKNQEKFVEDNTFDESDIIQLIIYSQLTPKTGVILKGEENEIYQITQVKEKYNRDDIPITIFGGRKVLRSHNKDILSNSVKTFKSTDINKISYGPSDNLDRRPVYENKNSEYIDNIVNAKHNNALLIPKKDISDKELLEDDLDLIEIKSGGASPSNQKIKEKPFIEPESIDEETDELLAAESRNFSRLNTEKSDSDNSNSNVDPEGSNSNNNSNSNSNNNIDPEVSNSNNNSDSESDDENINAKPINIESQPELEYKEDDDLSKESEEILFDEDIELENIEGINIVEEELIPEEKIIANELDQKNDLFNELMKMEPEFKRVKQEVINKNNKTLSRFIHLKLLYSVKNREGEIIDYFTNGNNYKKTLDDFLSKDFSSEQYYPLVSEQKKIYLSEERNEIFEMQGRMLKHSENAMIIPDRDLVTSDIGIRDKYRRGTQRINYSYKSEMIETYNNIDSYIPNQTENGYEIILDNDSTVIRNCFDERNCMINGIDKHILNGPLVNMGNDYSDIIVEGNRINITGIVKYPENHINNTKINEAKLLECVNNKYKFYDDKEITQSLNVEVIDLNIEKSDSVKMCFNNKGKSFEISGTIIDIEDNGSSYIVKPNEEYSSQEYNILKINKRDKNVVFRKESEIMKMVDGERLCYDASKDKLCVYIFPEINNLDEFKDCLDNILPNVNLVINSLYNELKVCNNFEELENILKKQNIFINNLSYDNFKVLSDILEYNLSNINKKYKKIKTQYNDFLKRKPERLKKENFTINNSSLERISPYYGDYPFFNSNIDSNEQRYKWIQSSYDSGYLYYKYIIQGIQKKLQQHKEKILRNLQQKKSEIEGFIRLNESNLQVNIASGLKGCPEYRLVKIYKSKDDLDRDNLRNDIAIDNDKIVKVEKTNIVQVGQYCILEKSPTERLLYKRIEVTGGRKIWALDSEKNIDSIIQSNKDFCNMQAKSLDEMTPEYFKSNACSFSEENGCVPKEVIIIEQELKKLKIKLQDVEDQIQKILNSDIDAEILDKNIKISEKKLLLHQNHFERKYKKELNKYKDIIEQDIDEEHKALYDKINKYLENISLLDKEKYYELLEILYKKYGRAANNETENNKNIYCVKGSKVLFCKHHLLNMNLYKNPDLKSKENMETYNELITTYGIENEGKYWCSNCGQEIGIAEYETVEGFTQTGAHNVTHEILDDDEDENIVEDDMFKSLQMFIDEKEKDAGEGVFNIFKIIYVLLEIMGIKLSQKDEMEVIKECKIIEKNMPVKQKNRETILILKITAVLFIKLQTSIPEYKVNKPHANCVASLKGYPLAELDVNKSGIEYICCILNNLKGSGGEWNSLKKIKKIEPTFLKILNSIKSDDPNIEHLYKTKINYLLRQKEKTNTIVNTWNRFKPPLKTFTIDLENYEGISTENMNKLSFDKINVLRNNFSERLQQLSLKIIEILNTEINNSDVVNSLYQPVPVSNSCCLSNINKDYEYNSYFSKTSKTSISKISSSLNNMEKSREELLENPSKISQNVYPEFPKPRFPSFRKNIYPNNDEIKNETITKLHVKFINEGENTGDFHVYDENDICTITGINKNDIIQNNYSIDDYDNLIKNINKNKLRNVDFKTILYDDLEIINKVKLNRDFTRQDYLTNFYNTLKQVSDEKQLENIYNDLETQITVEVEEIVNKLSQNLNIKNRPAIAELTMVFKDLGSYKKIYDENLELHGKDFSLNKMFLDKTDNIKRYINQLKTLLSKIVNNKRDIHDDNKRFIVQNMKLKDDHINKLSEINSKEHFFIEYFIKVSKKNENSDVFNTLSKVININTRYINDIVGKEHVFDCQKNIKKINKITNRGASLITHYLFIILIDILCSIYSGEGIPIVSDRSYADEDNVVGEMRAGGKNKIQKLKRRKYRSISKIGGNPEEGDEEGDEEGEEEGREEGEEEGRDEDQSNIEEAEKLEGKVQDDVEIEDSSIELTLNTNLIKNKNNVANDLIYKFLLKIDEERQFIDKHTIKHNNEIINTQYDTEKEENLNFIAELDKEARQSFKALVAIGVDTYKSLSKKRKELYFSNLDEVSEETGMTEEDRNQFNRQQAEEQLGSNFTENQYQDWLSDRNNNDQEDMLAFQERDVLQDEDHDDDNTDVFE